MNCWLALFVVVASPTVGRASAGVHFGLSQRWKLESELGVPLRPLKMAQPSNVSPDEDFENLYVHCQDSVMFSGTTHFHQHMFNVYQDILQQTGEHSLKSGQDAGLSLQEVIATKGWTTSHYEFLNKIAWGADAASVWIPCNDAVHCDCPISRAEVWPYITVLVSALDKMPPIQPQTLWRGDWRKPDYLFEIGHAWAQVGFTSTSHSADVALDFLHSGGGSLWAVETHRSGKDISSVSGIDEGEVLFPMGSRFEIVECSPTTISDALRQKVEDINKGLEEKGKTDRIDIICMKETHEGDTTTTQFIQSSSGLCVDLPGGDTSNGALLWLWDCYGGDSQLWLLEDGQLKYAADPSKCVDLLGGDATNGNVLGLWDCYGGDGQQWGYDGMIWVGDGSLSKCVQRGGETVGSPVVIWDCDTGSETQGWTMTDPSSSLVIV